MNPRPPRYMAKRALPERAFIPGRGAKPALDDQPAPYLSADRWRDNVAYLWGVDLYNYGFPWEAHEAWEGVWRTAKHDETQATFLQGLIQCAAAQVKTIMGDADAAQRLRVRGLARLSRVHPEQGDHYMGVDLPRLLPEQTRGRDLFVEIWLAP